MIVRARILLPLARPPIEDGAVLISGRRIVRVGRWSDVARASGGRPRVDLGDAILLPGLVNAHCHLDYTGMADLGPPPKTFTDWIPLIIAAKSGYGYSDYAHAWLAGAAMLLRTGTTTVADIEAVPDLLPEVWEATPLRVFSFLEMTGLRARRAPGEVLREAVEKIESLRHSRCRAALSPHAPYSTLPELLRLSARLARRRRWRICTHVAESAEEFEMFARARGKMYDWLKRNERDMSDCGLGSPVQHLVRHQLSGENLLAVHVNALARGDATLLRNHRVHVVHCPRSHAFFRHPPFLYRRLSNAGVNVCLGTDSLATVRQTGRQKPELNLFEEMRVFAARHRGVSAREILRLATVHGARALGLAGRIGELSANAFADLISIRARPNLKELYDSVIAHTGPVAASMVDGCWAIPPAN